MLYVSFVEIFQKSVGAFTDAGHSDANAYLYATLTFFSGIVFIRLIDGFVHWLDPDHDHEMNFPEDEDHGGNTYDPKASKPLNSKDIELQLGTVATIDGSADSSNKLTKKQQDERKLKKMGIMTALAIGIHNFPEGLATFVGALDDPKVGGALAVALGIHNIPEGLCVAIPIYYATGDRWKAFGWVSERVIDIDAIPSYEGFFLLPRTQLDTRCHRLWCLVSLSR